MHLSQFTSPYLLFIVCCFLFFLSFCCLANCRRTARSRESTPMPSEASALKLSGRCEGFFFLIFFFLDTHHPQTAPSGHHNDECSLKCSLPSLLRSSFSFSSLFCTFLTHLPLHLHFFIQSTIFTC